MRNASGGLTVARSLAVRLVLLLSLALLPLGLIAVWQTREMAQSLRDNARISLLALTEQAAMGERRAIYQAMGAADALGAVLPALDGSPDECVAYLVDFVQDSADYVYAAFVPPNGLITCNSRDVILNIADLPDFRRQVETPRVRVEAGLSGGVSGENIVSLTKPVFEDGGLAGFVTLTLPSDKLAAATDGSAPETPLSLVTFNASGDIVSAERDLTSVADRLPENIDLPDLASRGARAFSSNNIEGAPRDFAVVPLIPRALYAIGSRPQSGVSLSGPTRTAPVWAFPLVMWIASLVVGYYAVHSLVIGHVQRLVRQMRGFARTRTLPAQSRKGRMAQELVEMESTFLQMAESILRDEATLENALREKSDLVDEKNVLLKEVHHRVKNNLQLIASIMSMQARISRNQETRAVVRRLQERVLGLATIHRRLYQTENLNNVDAADLVREMADQMIVVGGRDGLRTTLELDTVVLYPDQAVPLSLLAAEAVTNALKYAAAANGDTAPWMTVALQKVGESTVVFEVKNSSQLAENKSDDDNSTGLGSQLIRAFAAQLGADIDVTDEAGTHTLRVTFQIAAFSQPAEGQV